MSKELTVNNEKMPDFMKQDKADSLEFDISDIKMSRLSLVHGIMSDIISEGKAKPGEFIDSITQKNYGDKVDIVILKYTKKWLKFKGNNGPLDKSSEDGKFWDNGDPLTDDEKYLNLFHTFYILLKDEPKIPTYFSFSRNGVPNGKKLINIIQRFLNMGEARYSRFYTLTSQLLEKDGNKFLVPLATPGSFLSKEEYEHAKKVCEALKGANIEHAEKPVQEEIEID